MVGPAAQTNAAVPKREPALVIRADASVAMGTGHVMRCLALAQSWQDAGGSAVFAMAQTTPDIRERLLAESCKVADISAPAGTHEDLQRTIDCACEERAKWVVVDGYQFSAGYQRSLKTAGYKVLWLDDYGHASDYSADAVLNQNAQASENMYRSREPYTQLLLGPRFCLLRREFAAWRGWKRQVAKIGRKVLVTMGGSDPGNFTGLVIQGLREVTDIEAIVVVGGSNPHLETLRNAAARPDWMRVEKSVANMPELMAWADLAVSAAGSTCWEMCLLQLPMLLIDLAGNQKPIAGALHQLGAAIHLGAAEDVTAKNIAERVIGLLGSETSRVTLSQRCGSLVDGEGARRVAGKLARA